MVGTWIEIMELALLPLGLAFGFAGGRVSARDELRSFGYRPVLTREAAPDRTYWSETSPRPGYQEYGPQPGLLTLRR